MASPSLSNSNTATKAYGGNKGGRTKKENQILQDLDLMDSPHKERDLIGEDVDLDLLYLSLKRMQESWEGEGDSKLKRVKNGGQNRAQELGNFGEEDPLK